MGRHTWNTIWRKHRSEETWNQCEMPDFAKGGWHRGDEVRAWTAFPMQYTVSVHQPSCSGSLAVEVRVVFEERQT